MVMVLDQSMPPVFHAMFAIPNIALENAMACRVFRALRLGYIEPDAESEVTTSMLWTRTSFVVSPTPAVRSLWAGNCGLEGAGRNRRPSELNIQITRTVDRDDIQLQDAANKMSSPV
ncbi:hypothetical protein DFH06DRAFT_453890 [Mycena polygramma]|nr:hypothetical protein DFH06DRAFT_453890 [Mycena polygramma]